MAINLYMFSSLMKLRIGVNMSGLIVTIQLHLLIFTKFQLLKEFLIHKSSHLARAIDRYSTFALDWAITLCFLLFQDTRFPPRNTWYHVVDLLPVWQPAQSTLQYPKTWVFILFFILQFVSWGSLLHAWGFCINWLTTCTG